MSVLKGEMIAQQMLNVQTHRNHTTVVATVASKEMEKFAKVNCYACEIYTN